MRNEFNPNILEFYRSHRDEIDILADHDALFVLAIIKRIGPVTLQSLSEHIGWDKDNLGDICNFLWATEMIDTSGIGDANAFLSISEPGENALKRLFELPPMTSKSTSVFSRKLDEWSSILKSWIRNTLIVGSAVLESLSHISAIAIFRILIIPVALIAAYIVLRNLHPIDTNDSVAGQVNERLTQGRLVLPEGASAYDLWQELKLRYPRQASPDALTLRAFSLLKIRGNEVFQEFHDDSFPDNSSQVLEAYRIYEWAVEIDPGDSRLRARRLYALAQIDLEQGKNEDAIEELFRAITYDDCLSLAHNSLGRIFAGIKYYEKGEFHYKRAIDCDPKWCAPRTSLGDMYVNEQHFKEAERVYQGAIGCEPENALFYYKLGSLYQRLKRFCLALRQYQIALDLVERGGSINLRRQQLQERIKQLRSHCRE